MGLGVYKFNWLWGIVLVVLACGCRRNEFRVAVEVPAGDDRALTLTYYASDPAKGWLLEQVVPLQGGRAECKAVTRLPSVCMLSDRASAIPQVLFYAERGDNIKITGDNADPLTWRVTGNQPSERLSDWRLANAPAIDKALKGDFFPLNKAVAAYVAAHRDDPVSALLLAVYYDRRSDEAGFRKAWHMLGGDALEREWLDLVPRADFDNVPAGADVLPESIVLNTRRGYADTVRLKGKPVLLYFTRMRMDGYRDGIASLKRAFAQGDSASRVVIEVSFEPDSAGRMSQVRFDSLRNVVRAWMPLGPNDPAAVLLGAGAPPYVITANPDGKVTYRGHDLGAGLAKMKD